MQIFKQNKVVSYISGIIAILATIYLYFSGTPTKSTIVSYVFITSSLIILALVAAHTCFYSADKTDIKQKILREIMVLVFFAILFFFIAVFIGFLFSSTYFF
jgi:hypothetical protein